MEFYYYESIEASFVAIYSRSLSLEEEILEFGRMKGNFVSSSLHLLSTISKKNRTHPFISKHYSFVYLK